MKTILVIGAGLAALALAGCKAPDTASRFDGHPTAISASRAAPPAIDLHQSLAAVSMKDALPAGASLEISAKVRAILADHARH